MNPPITPTANGRDRGGRFAFGNPGGPGRPPNEKAMSLRRIFLEEISEDDMRAIVRVWKEQALAGDKDAIRDILDRIQGRPMPADVAAEIEELASKLAELEKNK